MDPHHLSLDSSIKCCSVLEMLILAHNNILINNISSCETGKVASFLIHPYVHRVAMCEFGCGIPLLRWIS